MWLYVTSFPVCVCVCVCGYLSGRDYVMECAGGRVESRPVRRVTYSHKPTLIITNVNQHSNLVT
jgi:hypothetical protein